MQGAAQSGQPVCRDFGVGIEEDDIGIARTCDASVCRGRKAEILRIGKNFDSGNSAIAIEQGNDARIRTRVINDDQSTRSGRVLKNRSKASLNVIGCIEDRHDNGDFPLHRRGIKRQQSFVGTEVAK